MGTPDLERLKAAIRSSYSVPVDSLELVSTTGSADSYVGRTDPWQFGLTAWPDPAAAGPHVPTLRLEQWLDGQGLSFRVPVPLSTVDGGVVATCDGVPFIVFELVYGRSMAPWPAWTPEGRDDQSRTLAAIHALTPPDDLRPPPASFDVPDPVVPELRGLVDRAREAAAVAAAIDCAPVLCNNAFFGDNIVVKRNRVAGVLDWEHAVLGPPELDLQLAVLGDISRFLDVYAEAGGTRALHLELFERALLRRLVDEANERGPVDERWLRERSEVLDEQLDQLRSAL